MLRTDIYGVTQDGCSTSRDVAFCRVRNVCTAFVLLKMIGGTADSICRIMLVYVSTYTQPRHYYSALAEGEVLCTKQLGVVKSWSPTYIVTSTLVMIPLDVT